MSSLPPDPYKILGVSKDAQLPEIRSAHRKLVLKCHPDKVQDPKLKEEKQKEFQQVQQAYELLSNENERIRYDDKVRLEELRRDRGMTSTSTSSPRSSKRHETKYYDVREAEPRPSTFAASTSPHNVYSHTPPSRSFDEEIYARRFEEKPRSARKAASYEYEREKPSRKESERQRRKEDEEWTREKERERERLRDIRLMEEKREREREREQRERDALREKEKEAAAKKEKDRRKEERKEEKKKTEKDRRKESDEKHRRHKTPYVETYPDDREEVIYSTSSSSKTDKKKSSSSRKYDEVPEPPQSSQPPPTTERERKNSANLESAIRYLNRSGAKPPSLARAQTYHDSVSSGMRHIAPIAVPTPPPAAAAAFPPPPPADIRDASLEEDGVKRSSARPRRMSHDTPRSSKEKSSHKKSGSSRDPIIVDAASPTSRIIPTFQKSHSIPIPLNRSSTDYSRPPPAAGLERAATWMADTGHGRDRSRSRHARYTTDESSEEDRERRHRRSRRTTQSPEPMPAQSTKRYTVTAGKTVPIQELYLAEESPRNSKRTYAMPNTSVRRGEPPASYYDDVFEEEPQPIFPSVKYSATFDANEINFSDVQHSHHHREEVY
ncbi:DnaJ-domain-containing protein [Hypoxylon trugodes]|uniref:DnaJ-domain-containing protein n=1 Tax=Hypoxylon trugodes TaxID=326681 RepID=UPI00219BD3BC|nr:DnaJ-domain-containing protein [Hypoxylon trugodes]KAI1390527.1 DnaJ-domain-containing protein [Hypoxylon trugodes]